MDGTAIAGAQRARGWQGALGWAAIASLLAAAAVLACTEILDPDLGHHVAMGRILLSDFASARHATMGQAPEVLRHAYSYWLYQIVAAGFFDRVGPASIVCLRALLIVLAFGLAAALSLRRGASAAACSAGLLLGLVVSQERFLDRPELASFVLWAAALWLLLRHRGGRGAWLLVPLQTIWVNTHLWFALLPAAFVVFVAGDWLEGSRDLRRPARLLAAILLASFLHPQGPGSWSAQIYLAQFLGRGLSLPFRVQEMVSPFDPYESTPAVWAFRIGMPIALAAAFAARRRLGWGAVLILLASAILGGRARRAMPLFGLAAAALLPVALDAGLARLRAASARRTRTACAGIALLVGLSASWGFLSGRVFLAMDRDVRVSLSISPRFAALDAARFLRERDVQGPLFCHPLAAGAVVLQNGTRLPPFLDARWFGTPQTIDGYHELRSATDESIASVWERVDSRRRFEAVVVDFYEMQALLRHLSLGHPDWATVHVEPTAAVLCRRGGKNAGVIAACEPELAWARAGRDERREEELAARTIRFLESARPSFWKPLRFPYEALYRANYALQLRLREEAQAAYLDLLAREGGSLHVSAHRIDVLNNILWTLMESSQHAAIDVLAEALAREPSVEARHRRSIRLHQARALEAMGDTARAAELARGIAVVPPAPPEERWGAWCRIASVRAGAEEFEAAVEALRRAARELPGSAETFRALGANLDLRLARRAEALEAYETYRALGGSDPWIEERIRTLRGDGVEEQDR